MKGTIPYCKPHMYKQEWPFSILVAITCTVLGTKALSRQKLSLSSSFPQMPRVGLTLAGRTFEDLFHLVVVILIQTADLLWLFGTLQLSVHIAMLRAVVRLGQEFTSHRVPHHRQSIHLLIEQLCSAAHAGLRNFSQPLLPMTWGIDLPTRAGNAPASIQRLEATHHPRLVFADGQITTRQLPQRP